MLTQIVPERRILNAVSYIIKSFDRRVHLALAELIRNKVVPAHDTLHGFAGILNYLLRSLEIILPKYVFDVIRKLQGILKILQMLL